ncbi:histone-lysine N-methyltransferase PRDM9-like [Ostrinia furnacalis]|uniref:histone-lysine N-methyltransferase PRDM9-like n=1 Tax=Ostrinia furnacalis TaxID=93504 RepID=UPI0010392EC9|nr:histone-lysine N-methyltransferase PRDM9-like [Ostrinia furnacalis]
MSENAPQEQAWEIPIEEEDFSGDLLTESDSQPYTNYCAQCDAYFDDLTEFEYHNANDHKSKEVTRAQEPSFPCPECGTSFRRQYHLQRHIQSIHRGKQYTKCPVCRVEFADKDILLQHIKKKHTGKKEAFRCRECRFKCASLKELLLHEVNHQDRHVCPHCSLSYKRKDHMIRHIKGEHMKIVVVCPICDQMYKRKDHLARHMREKHHRKVAMNSDYVSNR